MNNKINRNAYLNKQDEDNTLVITYVTDSSSYAISVGVNDQKPVTADSNGVYNTLSYIYI